MWREGMGIATVTRDEESSMAPLNADEVDALAAAVEEFRRMAEEIEWFARGSGAADAAALSAAAATFDAQAVSCRRAANDPTTTAYSAAWLYRHARCLSERAEILRSLGQRSEGENGLVAPELLAVNF